MIKVKVGNNLKRTSVIVDEKTTLRTCLNDAEIDYTRGQMTLDGSPLMPGDMDKTFEDFGIIDECFLLNVVKADNAASVIVAGNQMIITANYDYNDFALVKKHAPKALNIYEENEPIFSVAVGENSSVSKYGISFERSRDGKAQATAEIPSSVEDVKSYIAEEFGNIIRNLGVVEHKVGEVIPDIVSDINTIKDNVQVVI